MEFFIFLHDNEGVCHNVFQSKFGSETTLDQLKEEIRSEWQIIQKHQHLFLGGQQILERGSKTLADIGLKNDDKVVVKHASLPRWVECQVFSENLKTAGTEHVKSRIAKLGSEILRELEDTKFFTTYAAFGFKFVEMLKIFDRYVIGAEEYIKLATSNYFKNYYKNDTLKMDFFPKPHGGAQGGFICKVQDAGEFFVKNHTFMASRGSRHSRVDCRKIFVYRLLYLIGVGAEPHFIPSAYSKHYTSALALHVATKKVLGFKRRADRSSCHFTSHHQLQIDMLVHLLYLSDLNSGNYGVDEKQQLVVVDFTIPNPKSCIHRASQINNFMKSDRREECKEILTKWNLLNNFNEAKCVAKTDFDRLTNIDWKDGYEMYLETVGKNIDLMMQ